MATTDYFPVSGTAVDGVVIRSGVDEAIGVIRAGAGMTTDTTDPTYVCYIDTGPASTSNKFFTLKRGIFLFDTTLLPANAVISSATLNFWVTATANGFSGAASANSALVAVSSAPSSNTSLANGDYSNLGSTDFGRSVSQGSLSTGAYNSITLNASGIANITNAGISKFGLRYGWDFDNTITGITWATSNSQGVQMDLASHTGTTQDPKLSVTYTLPDGNMFLVF